MKKGKRNEGRKGGCRGGEREKGKKREYLAPHKGWTASHTRFSGDPDHA